jgi:hypothetical protein
MKAFSTLVELLADVSMKAMPMAYMHTRENKVNREAQSSIKHKAPATQAPQAPQAPYIRRVSYRISCT